MRVLGITSEGKLGFVVSTEEFLAANEAYLKVSTDTPEELILMTEDELNDYKKTEQGQSIGSIKIKDSIKGVYSITGVKVADELNETLPKGIYIVNGKKIIRQ